MLLLGINFDETLNIGLGFVYKLLLHYLVEASDDLVESKLQVTEGVVSLSVINLAVIVNVINFDPK